MAKKQPQTKLPDMLAGLPDQVAVSEADLLLMFRIQLASYNLLKKLREVFEVGSPEQMKAAAGEKDRYVRASLAVNTFLRVLNQEMLAERFLSLAEAIDDASKGVPHPLTSVDKPAGKRGADPYPRTVWRILAMLCVGLEIIRTADRGGFENAVAQIARRHGKTLGEMTRSQRDPKASLKRWHKSFDAQTVKNEVALAFYNHGIGRFRKDKDTMSLAKIRKLGETFVNRSMQDARRLTSH